MKTEFPIRTRELEYLKGLKLSNGEYFTLLRSGRVYGRNELLIQLSKSKRILHMGCADHIELIKKKRSMGNYLHDLLINNASYVVGLDSNFESLSEMKRIGINNIYLINEYTNEEEFDCLLIPDVIEHVSNVSDFLQSLKKYKVKQWIFTTPNAYRLENRGQFASELINTDHRYWFTPYTLTKCLYENGFKVENFYLTDNISWRKPISSLLKNIYPLCRDGLAVVAYVSE